MTSITLQDVDQLQRKMRFFSAEKGDLGPGELHPVVRQKISQLIEEDKCHYYQGDEGELKGFFAPHSFYDSFFGQNCKSYYLYCDPSDRVSVDWMNERIQSQVDEPDSDHIVFLPASLAMLLPEWMKKGYGIDAIGLGGSPRRALELVKSLKKGQANLLAEEDIEVEQFLDVKLLPDVSALRDRVFKEYPEACTFYFNPGVREEFEAFTKERIRTGKQWTIRKNGELVGFFGFGVSEDKEFGKCANMDFAVDASLRGIGMGWLAYRMMLESMVAKGINRFKGGRQIQQSFTWEGLWKGRCF